MEIRNKTSLDRAIPTDAGVDIEVAAGSTVDVADELAGAAPNGDDLGFGLLAQVDVWELVDAAGITSGAADKRKTRTSGAPAADDNVPVAGEEA